MKLCLEWDGTVCGCDYVYVSGAVQRGGISVVFVFPPMNVPPFYHTQWKWVVLHVYMWEVNTRVFEWQKATMSECIIKILLLVLCIQSRPGIGLVTGTPSWRWCFELRAFPGPALWVRYNIYTNDRNCKIQHTQGSILIPTYKKTINLYLLNSIQDRKRILFSIVMVQQ